MKKLIKMLQKYNIRNDVVLTRWQRNIIYDFIVDYCEGVKKQDGRK
jgi:hypothetical protein